FGRTGAHAALALETRIQGPRKNLGPENGHVRAERRLEARPGEAILNWSTSHLMESTAAIKIAKRMAWCFAALLLLVAVVVFWLAPSGGSRYRAESCVIAKP